MEEKKRKQTAQQKLNNFLRSDEAQTYPLCITKRMLLHALASYCYYKDECNPSLASLAVYCQLSDTEKIAKHLKILQALGLIRIESKNGARNKYYWQIPEVSDYEIYRKKDVDN